MEYYMSKETIVVKLSGEIDHHTAEQIREFIDRTYQKRKAKNILLDFENVKFMDSAGIGLLMGRYKNVSIVGGRIALIHVSDRVDKILDLAGLYKLFTLHKTKQEALDYLA